MFVVFRRNRRNNARSRIIINSGGENANDSPRTVQLDHSGPSLARCALLWLARTRAITSVRVERATTNSCTHIVRNDESTGGVGGTRRRHVTFRTTGYTTSAVERFSRKIVAPDRFFRKSDNGRRERNTDDKRRAEHNLRLRITDPRETDAMGRDTALWTAIRYVRDNRFA